MVFSTEHEFFYPKFEFPVLGFDGAGPAFWILLPFFQVAWRQQHVFRYKRLNARVDKFVGQEPVAHDTARFVCKHFFLVCNRQQIRRCKVLML